MQLQSRLSATGLKETNVVLLGYVFQPVVNINREIVGFEALGRCSPFPGVGIYTGTAEHIKNVSFASQAREFCLSVSKLIAVFGNKYKYSFNVDPSDCTVENIELLCEFCERFKVKKQLIELELIETSATNLPGVALEEAKLKGFSTALDDFGVGYSNVGAVLHYPFDTIKFDRLFLTGDKGALSWEMLSAIHDVVKRSGFKTVIEGVEDKQILPFIDKLKADYYQGWLFGRGLSVDDLLSNKTKI
ncbi:MAG: EAL domain-containing protein (putative c-di-GMP-specific phosphodiesterase class I) [Alteromonas macleodii]|jgi:EAL domain-containing protein (putative c-di-GMP-specific phosphodiesterase class I)